jgi:hypothetical protein
MAPSPESFPFDPSGNRRQFPQLLRYQPGRTSLRLNTVSPTLSPDYPC